MDRNLGGAKMGGIDFLTLALARKYSDENSFSGDYNDLTNKPESLPASDVYDWAKQPEKPVYTAEEVGALPEDVDVPLNFRIERPNENSPFVQVFYGDPVEMKAELYIPFAHMDGSLCFVANELASFYGDLGGHPDTYNMVKWTDQDKVEDLTEENGPYLVLSGKYEETISETESSIEIYTYVISLKDCFKDYIKFSDMSSHAFEDLTTTDQTIIGSINEIADALRVKKF